MRIAMLSWESLHSISVGGMATVVSEMAAAMERKGHEVHVFTRMGERQSHYHFDGWINPAEVKAVDGIGPVYLTTLFVGRMSYQKGFDLLVEAIPFILSYYPLPSSHQKRNFCLFKKHAQYALPNTQDATHHYDGKSDSRHSR